MENLNGLDNAYKACMANVFGHTHRAEVKKAWTETLSTDATALIPKIDTYQTHLNNLNEALAAKKKVTLVGLDSPQKSDAEASRPDDVTINAGDDACEAKTQAQIDAEEKDACEKDATEERKNKTTVLRIGLSDKADGIVTRVTGCLAYKAFTPNPDQIRVINCDLGHAPEHTRGYKNAPSVKSMKEFGTQRINAGFKLLVPHVALCVWDDHNHHNRLFIIQIGRAHV